METRGQNQTKTGVVVSDRMSKTVVVEVARRVQHPVYGKTVTLKKKFVAHVQGSISCREGDKVRIISCRPISRTKRWRVVEVLGQTV